MGSFGMAVSVAVYCGKRDSATRAGNENIVSEIGKKVKYCGRKDIDYF